MNASVNVERNSWRLPPDETVQVADPRSKSAQVKEVIDSGQHYILVSSISVCLSRRLSRIPITTLHFKLTITIFFIIIVCVCCLVFPFVS